MGRKMEREKEKGGPDLPGELHLFLEVLDDSLLLQGATVLKAWSHWQGLKLAFHRFPQFSMQPGRYAGKTHVLQFPK